MSKHEEIAELARSVTKDLIDRGKLIEAGFAAFRLYVIAKDAPPDQVSEMRLAFMAGAEHVWSSVMSSLDEDKEPTPDDLARMGKIQAEIDEWRIKLSERVDPARGNA